MTIYANLVAGDWRTSPEFIASVNPSDHSDVVGRYAIASLDDLDVAVSAARDAQRRWVGLTSQERADRLDAVASEILSRREEIACMLSREEGKTLPEARAEVLKSAHIFRFYAGEAVRMSGEHIASIRPDIHADIERRPLGVIGLITPWNFPVSIPAWKSAPALAFGNAVILKPSELTNGCAWMLADILNRHLIKGVFQLLMGQGDMGARIASHSGIDGVSFTGSVATGRKIAQAVHGRSAHLQMEMGGKNPLIILDDANLDRAIDSAVRGAFYSTGQRCTASSRIIVQKGIADTITARLKETMERLRIGPALDDDIDIGPLVSTAQLDRVQGYVALGREEGAELVTGGDVVERRTKGNFMLPALFADTRSSQRINQEEIFGPVATIIAVDNLDEAIMVANDTQFGLAAGIFTRSLSNANEFRRRTAAGMLMVNLPTVGTDYHVPFGGIGNSSYGTREMGRAAREFYTESRTIYTMTQD